MESAHFIIIIKFQETFLFFGILKKMTLIQIQNKFSRALFFVFFSFIIKKEKENKEEGFGEVWKRHSTRHAKALTAPAQYAFKGSMIH